MKKIIKNPLSVVFIAAILLTILSCGNDKGKEKVDIKIQDNTQVTIKEPKKQLSLGEKNFLLCAACHNLKKGEPHKTGPSLYGVFGRKAGTAEGFTYSDAVKNSGIVWSEETIRNWLTKPTEYIPGTTMAFIGIKNKKQQDLLIEYLKEQTK